jgi:hypothetical protein
LREVVTRGLCFPCRRHGDVLGRAVLQRDAAAGRQHADGDDSQEGRGRVHLLPGLGVPEEGLLQRLRVPHAAAGPVPHAAERSPGYEAVADRRPCLLLLFVFVLV